MNILDKFNKIDEYFAPKIVGEVNDVYVKIAKIKGDEIPWHNHHEEDEMFYVLEGTLLFEIENEEPFRMYKGDLYIVTKGINHRVSSKKECKIMLIENKTTEHTGDVQSEITKSIADQL
ncbi:cupin domain-containing protein [Prolixibacteraceae bacterium Z1-6]|uniref:Cupin domain-containing protein n=1 Tax=Draconibacterium aestuarii TaxID=2998507 RepID=A0A9X3J6K2_9BACT|nr:cupin domain-containing protein [Prolixibacteraceae bacterium Z1-6]